MLSPLLRAEEASRRTDPDNREQVVSIGIELDQGKPQPHNQKDIRASDERILPSAQLAASGSRLADEFQQATDKFSEVFGGLSGQWIIGRVVEHHIQTIPGAVPNTISTLTAQMMDIL